MSMLSASGGTIAAIIVPVLVLIITTSVVFATRFKRCPSDKIMVIYGKLLGKKASGEKLSALCLHGGAKLVVPLIQSYSFLDLTPFSIPVDLRNALSRQNIRIDVPSSFTVGISTEPGVMQNAAERLLGLSQSSIQDLAKDIIFGQLRLVVATMEIEEINTDRDKFLEAVSWNVETELKKIGLRLINVNVTDISDESGYIDALGREAAAKAINDAKKSVAEKNRDGAIGEANARRDQRVEVSLAESQAIEGENTARILIAESEASRREREAEALKRATSTEKIQAAKALEEAYAAEKLAESARAERERATQAADIIVSTEIAKQKLELEAEAEAEQIRRRARGEADGTYAKMEAQARGYMEILSKQAAGLAQIVQAAGDNPNDAVKLMIADKIEELVRIQVEAVKNLKIDKVTVWDGGATGTDGKTSTANFLSGLMKSIPPMQELFQMAGMELPSYLGKDATVAAEERALQAKALEAPAAAGSKTKGKKVPKE